MPNDSYHVWYQHYIDQGLSSQTAAQLAYERASIADQVQRQHRADNRRVPISTGETLVHLIMTLCTFGLWIPIWMVRAARGRREYMR